MPSPPPPLHSRWKKGQSGNPLGKKGNPFLTRDKIFDMLCLFAAMTFEDLKKKAEDVKAPALEVMLSRIMMQIMKDGDYAGLESLLNRSIGKVKDIAEVHQHNHDDEFKKHPKENVIALLRQMKSKESNEA